MSRTQIMLSCFSSNTASPTTSVTSRPYPRVSHLSDASTRAGVCRSPSRLGSSPSCSSISCTSVWNGLRTAAVGSVCDSWKLCRLADFIWSRATVSWTPMRCLKLLLSATQAGGTALAALWTFPSMLASAFLVAWGAEAAQFLISQGLALAILAWLQTLPEFAVEAVIAWDAGRDAERAHLAIANLTGAIRLLLGLGWPMIYFVFAAASRRRGAGAGAGAATLLPPITLEPEHALEVMGLVPPLLYFALVLWRQRLCCIDAAVLVALYGAYLWVPLRNPPREVEASADAPPV